MASPSTDLCRSACRAVLLSCCPPVLLSCPPPAMKAASCSVTAPGPWALHAGPCTQCCQSVLSPSPSLPCGVAHHPRTAAEDLRLARPRVSWFLLHALHAADGSSSPSPSAVCQALMEPACAPSPLSPCPPPMHGDPVALGLLRPWPERCSGAAVGYRRVLKPMAALPNPPSLAGAPLSRRHLAATLQPRVGCD